MKDLTRLLVIAIGTFALFSALVYQFYRVQIIQHEKWKGRATAQHEGLVKESFRRGTFWSNVSVKTGHPEKPQALALDIAKFHLHADPKAIPTEHREMIAEQLRLLIGRDVGEALEKRSRNRRLHMWITRQEADLIREWWQPFAREHKIPRNALFFVKDYQRSHPFGKLLGQALHTIRDYKEEKTEQGIPTGGLESTFNSYLSGKLGKRWMFRSPRHSLGVGTVIEEPEDGADVYLTVNHILQAIAEEEIESGVIAADGKSGWAIAMDPETGEILALAQYPFFYPDRYGECFDESVVKGVTLAYEPGSVMKAVNLAICLTANEELKARGEMPLFSPSEKIAVSNGRFPGRSKPLKDPRLHHYLNAKMAIQKSSNIYPARLLERLMDRLGPEWYLNMLAQMGFGKCTGIELPAESAGLLPRVGGPSWSKSAPWSMAMGYNVMVTSFQMLRVYACIANGGKMVSPTLVHKIEKEGEVLLESDRDERQILSPNVCRQVVRAMKFTTKTGGTAPKGDVRHYTEAGKTGTSEKVVNGEYDKSSHFCTFMGFTPAEHPKFILLVAVDEPKRSIYGGTAVAPIFRKIATRFHDYLGTTPDDPDCDDWAAEIKELREIYQEWNG